MIEEPDIVPGSGTVAHQQEAENEMSRDRLASGYHSNGQTAEEPAIQPENR